MPELMRLLGSFGAVSGLKVNWSKSCVYPLRPTLEPFRLHEHPTRLKWEYVTFKYLGVQVYHSDAYLIEGNVYRTLRSTRGSLRFWASLPLSPMGRISISKMLILPRFLYFFSALPVLILRKFLMIYID